MKAGRYLAALLALGAFGVMTATAMDGMDRHGCRYRGQYETDCSNDITEKFNENSSDPVCLNETVNFLVPVELTDEGAHNQKVIVYRHPEVCPPLYIDQYIAPVVPEYTWTIWCQNKIVAQGSGPAASCQGVTNKEYKCRFVTRLDRKCAPPATTSWVSRTVTKLDLWGVWTNVFLGTNLQLHAEGTPPYYWKSRDPEIADVDQEGLVTGVKTGKTTIMVWDANGCYADVLVKVLDMALVPDVNRDRAIGDDDRDKITEENPYRFWINDDQDFGDVSEGEQDIPGAGEKANCRQGWVSGRCDLLDFFPLWLDVKQVVDEIHEGDGVIIKLSQGDIAVKAVYTDLMRNKAGRYQIADVVSCGPNLDQKSFEAEVFAVYASGTALAESFLSRIRLEREKGVLLVEGTKKTTSPLCLEVWKGGTLLGRRELALSVDGVEEMYWYVNLRQGAPQITEPGNELPEAADFAKRFMFVHGYNVSEENARGWNAEIFKRLFWSASKARFYGVTWFGNDGQKNLPIVGEVTQNYYINVVHALNDAVLLKDIINGINDGQVVLAAHSLGNMISSEAVRLGARVDKYFALNAAVASEAYEGDLFNTNMVHAKWGLPSEGGFDRRLYAADWHRLFDDGRHSLTWNGYFQDVIPRMYNFYSSGEEVLDVHPHGNVPDPVEDVVLHWGENSWSMQEKLKGMNGLISAGDSACGGWQFNNDYARGVYNAELNRIVIATRPSEATSHSITDAMLRRYPFARKGSGAVSLLYDENRGGYFATDNRRILLASCIPALSLATGRKEIPRIEIAGRGNKNLNQYIGEEWPEDRNKGASTRDRWLHSDIKAVAYRFIHKAFEDISESAGIK